MSHYDTFIVRIWSNGGRALHGRIQHVSTSDQRDFRDLRRVLDFIRGHLRRPDQQSDVPDIGDERGPQD